MRHNSIVGRCKRRFRRTTIADPDAATTAVDLVKRSFVPDANEIDRLWCSDVTYIRTWEGWLCLATVIDIASRRVVGWAMADHMRTELVCDALRMAIHHRRPAPGLILHSDRGSAIHLDRVRRSARRQRHTPVPVPAGSVLGQRRRRELLRHPQNRARSYARMANPCPSP